LNMSAPQKSQKRPASESNGKVPCSIRKDNGGISSSRMLAKSASKVWVSCKISAVV
jgi:hypothetical protein